MKMSRKTIIAAAAVAASVAIGTGMATAGGGDDTEPAITGSDLGRASAAALAHTGQGRVTGTEVGDEESRYEVEVTLDDGSEVDVQLDESFAVVGSKAERAGEETADD